MKERLGFVGIAAVGAAGLATNVSLIFYSQRYFPFVFILALPALWGGIFFAFFPKPPGISGSPPAWWFIGGPVACALLFVGGVLFAALDW